jgi:hypothetical protein
MIPSFPEIGALSSALAAPMYAIPVDIFRILAGAVAFGYFARTLRETDDFSSPDGLIDHRLSHSIFPPTRLSLFQPGIPAWAFRATFALACLASLCVAVGYHARPAAVFLFLVAASTYRWNLLVMYVDDAIMHIVLFWLILLPVGRTLTLAEWLRDGSAAFALWSTVTVPGGTIRLFLTNLAIAYFVAGAYKWTSPMWRDGSALPAILRMPIAFWPDAWQPRHLPILRFGTYAALVTEPFYPLIFVLPAGSLLKWLVLTAVVGFHLGIIATLKIPFANLAMVGAIPIVLHEEIMGALFGRAVPSAATRMLPVLGVAELVAALLVGALIAMLLLELRFGGRLNAPPLWKTTVFGFRRNPVCMALWCVGIAQSYRLFDWIDVRNYHVRYEVVERVPGAEPRVLDTEEIFPHTIRHILLQSYLHGSIWHQIDPPGLRELRRSTLARYAGRYARRRGDTGTIEIFAVRQRITSDNLLLQQGVRQLLIRFRCVRGDAAIDEMSVDPSFEVAAPGKVLAPEVPRAAQTALG